MLLTERQSAQARYAVAVFLLSIEKNLSMPDGIALEAFSRAGLDSQDPNPVHGVTKTELEVLIHALKITPPPDLAKAVQVLDTVSEQLTEAGMGEQPNPIADGSKEDGKPG